jgi:hypothetical protein
LILTLVAGLQVYFIGDSFRSLFHPLGQRPLHAEQVLARCASLKISAGPSAGFHDRTQSDRFVRGTKPTLLHNARIWTGENNGTQVLGGDIFIDQGIIRGVGNVNLSAFGLEFDAMVARGELDVVDVRGAWVTPGSVPMYGLVVLILHSSETGSSTPIHTSVMHPHPHSAVRLITTRGKELFSRGFVRWMVSTPTTILMPCPLPVVLRLPSCYPAL